MEERMYSEDERLGRLPTDFETPSFQSVGEVVGAVFRLYRDNFLPLIKIIAVVAVPLIVAQYAFLKLVQLEWTEVVSMLFSSVGESLMAGALIYAVVGYLRAGVFPKLADSYRWGFRLWGKVLLCNILLKIIVALGMLALIIPGIIFSLMFALVIPVAVVENRLVKQSFIRSEYLTKNHRGQIFLTYFLFSFVIIIISLLTTFSLGGTTGAERSLLFVVAQGLIGQVLESSSTVLTLFIYLGILKDMRKLSPPVRDDTYVHPTIHDDQTRPFERIRTSQVETEREF
jgi:hypothetical protein